MKLFTVEQMVAAEKAADGAGVSYAQMMETAGRGVADAIMARLDVTEKNVLVLVGPGNNGGDGLVAGRYLAEAGADVAFYLFKSRDPEQDDNLAKIQAMGVFAIEAAFDQRFRVLRTRLNITHIVIDALLGTGVTRPIDGDLKQLLTQVRAGIDDATPPPQPVRLTQLVPPDPTDVEKQTAVFTVAVDCPSGLHCDTGELDPVALPADLTVTFAGPKWGHFLSPGAGAYGELVVVDIGIDPALPDVSNINTFVPTPAMIRGWLPKRPFDGHKGTFGQVAVVAGCDQYRGAPLLAGRGAFRAGAGLVALFLPHTLRDTATVHLPEATFPPVKDANRLTAVSAQTLQKTAEQVKAVLIGPGLGDAGEFMSTLFLPGAPPSLPPLVVDADGLNLLAQLDDWPSRLPANTVLTPHPGEMARLMGVDIEAVKRANRIALAREKAQAWGQVLLLKGAFTVVAAPDGRVAVLPFANPVLAVGGSGDVLGGVIAALLAQGGEPFETAVLGAYLHGLAGQLTHKRSGVLASEIADHISLAIETVRTGH